MEDLKFFAAAALTGLLSQHQSAREDGGPFSPVYDVMEKVVADAFKIAAMMTDRMEKSRTE
jgi:hypothetical protein